MTRVLSIDLDYISSPYSDLIRQMFNVNSSYRWSNFMENTPFHKSHFFIDQSNLTFCFNIFLKSLKYNPKVSFGYDHDSILFSINKENNIDLINIDHHDDVFSGIIKNPNEEYEALTKHNIINEGNWGALLHKLKKLNSFTWIKNINSDINGDRDNRAKQFLGNLYQSYLKEDYIFEDYNFDYVFLCLSPQYIFPDHWHYFSMFISAYEEFSEKTAVIYTDKYETNIRHLKTHEQILNQCSNKMSFNNLRKNLNNEII
jgi:hypothetical protein